MKTVYSDTYFFFFLSLTLPPLSMLPFVFSPSLCPLCSTINTGCSYILHSSGQLYSHKRKHERRETELAYRKFRLAQNMLKLRTDALSLPLREVSSSCLQLFFAPINMMGINLYDSLMSIFFRFVCVWLLQKYIDN